jgi:hypothetical protein
MRLLLLHDGVASQLRARDDSRRTPLSHAIEQQQIVAAMVLIALAETHNIAPAIFDHTHHADISQHEWLHYRDSFSRDLLSSLLECDSPFIDDLTRL